MREDSREACVRVVQEMWDWVLYGNPIPGMLVADLTEEEQARLRQSSTECSASGPWAAVD